MTLLLAGCSAAGPIGPTTVEGKPVFIDRLYPPGEGPAVSQECVLAEVYPQKAWLTGLSLAVKDDASEQPVEGLLSGLTLAFRDQNRHAQLNSLQGHLSPMLFQVGASVPEVRLPPGYGVALKSNELLSMSCVWQNRDLYRQPLEARTDVTLQLVSESDLQGRPAPKPLRVYPLSASVPLTADPGAGLLEPLLSDTPLMDASRHPAVGRWWMPPGHSQRKSLVSYQLPPETTVEVRYATAFLYQDWASLELYDLTEERSLLAFKATDPKAPLTRSFPQVLKLDSRHRLELRVSYQNPAQTRHLGVGALILYADEPQPQ